MIETPGDLVWDLPCVQLASYLEGGPLMWILSLNLHINQKSSDDDDDDFNSIKTPFWNSFFFFLIIVLKIELYIRNNKQGTISVLLPETYR